MREMLRRHWTTATKAARRRWLQLSLACLLAPTAVAADDGATLKPAYRLGVFPYLPALTIDRLYGPLADGFSLQLDRMVKLRTKSTFENFAEAIDDESYDILFVHPFFFVDAVDHHGYLPIARLEKPLKAVLVTMADAEPRDLGDLAGLTVGLPPKLAAVSKLIKAALMVEGMRPGLDVGIRHFRNGASCLQAVATGAVAACGVPSFLLEEVEAFASRPLRILFEAPPVSNFAFAVHSRVPARDRELLKQVVLSLGDGGVQGFGRDMHFVPIGGEDYASVRDQTTRLQTLAQR
ncbi:MAG: PhnD/SsuA/transferrin family substrate-binding protein [Alphaproteobacteria bacterium]